VIVAKRVAPLGAPPLFVARVAPSSVVALRRVNLRLVVFSVWIALVRSAMLGNLLFQGYSVVGTFIPPEFAVPRIVPLVKHVDKRP